jgi:RHS repeat-associated protein
MATYGYNGLNQRVKKTTGTTVTTSFFNQNWQELETSEPQSGDCVSFIWGLRYIDDLVLREKGSERLYSLADPNWNVVATVNATGTVQERMRYDAFGKVTWLDAAFNAKANSAYGWNRTFTGQVLDAETGLMLYRNRFYHTGLGRFVQRDPIGYEAKDENLYRYVENMPCIYTDPMGLRTWREWAREQARRARELRDSIIEGFCDFITDPCRDFYHCVTCAVGDVTIFAVNHPMASAAGCLGCDGINMLQSFCSGDNSSASDTLLATALSCGSKFLPGYTKIPSGKVKGRHKKRVAEYSNRVGQGVGMALGGSATLASIAAAAPDCVDAYQRCRGCGQ